MLSQVYQLYHIQMDCYGENACHHKVANMVCGVGFEKPNPCLPHFSGWPCYLTKQYSTSLLVHCLYIAHNGSAMKMMKYSLFSFFFSIYDIIQKNSNSTYLLSLFLLHLLSQFYNFLYYLTNNKRRISFRYLSNIIDLIDYLFFSFCNQLVYSIGSLKYASQKQILSC